MTLKEAIKFLIDEFYLDDQVYAAREMGHGKLYDGEPWKGNSWEHPFVLKFCEAVQVLKEELK